MIAREDRPGDKRLVGYVTGDRRPGRGTRRIGHTAARLHGARGGRRDRRAAADRQRQARYPRAAGTRVCGRRLPGPRHRRRGDPGGHLRAACSGRDRVGVDDSFFDLGGDSIIAMRLIAAINTSLRRRPRGAHPVRSADDRRTGPADRRRRRPGWSRWWPPTARGHSTVVRAEAGCGSSNNCKGPRRSTTWRRRCG